MPSFAITTAAYATIRERATLRGCSNDDIVADLLHQALPPFEPAELTAYEFGGLLVAYYGKRFAGIVLHAVPPSRDLARGHAARSGRGATTITEWCPWFAPLVAGRRLFE